MGAVLLAGYQVCAARWWPEGTRTHRLYTHKLVLVTYCVREGNFTRSDMTEAVKAAVLVQRTGSGMGLVVCGVRPGGGGSRACGQPSGGAACSLCPCWLSLLGFTLLF